MQKILTACGILSVILLCGAIGYATAIGVKQYIKSVECSTICGCQSDRGCHCVASQNDSGECKCNSCNCGTQVIKPLSEEEFENLKAAIKKDIERRKRNQ